MSTDRSTKSNSVTLDATRARLGVVEPLVSIDTRGLAVFRLLIGILLLLDAGSKIMDSAAVHLQMFLVPWALCLVLGVFSRTSNVLCWLIYLIGVREDLFSGGADLGNYVLLLLLFWGMFLPLGSFWSVDGIRSSPNPGPARRYLSVGTTALLFQVAIIYYSAGITKDFGEWVVAATAIQTILDGEAFPTTFGRHLVQYPMFLAGLSRATVLLEVLGPLLLFVPGRVNSRLRFIVVLAFLTFHLGLSLTMKLGLFPFVCMAAWVVFVPSEAWDALTRGKVRVGQEPWVDNSRLRNAATACLLVYISMSNLFNWFLPDHLAIRKFQKVGKEVCLYQQWFMFNTPSQGERK